MIKHVFITDHLVGSIEIIPSTIIRSRAAQGQLAVAVATLGYTLNVE